MALAPMTPVYFGDGRPNQAGEVDYGRGRFPPSPRTFQGLVRSTLLSSVKDLRLGPGGDRARIQALVGPPDRLLPDWQLRGPWLARWSEDAGGAVAVQPWMPAPGSLARARHPTEPLALVRAMSADGLRGDHDGSIWPVARGSFPRAWLSPADTLRVLGGRPPSAPVAELPPFAKREPHTGLQLRPGHRVADEGMLYTRDYHRFADGSGLVGILDAALSNELDPGALTRGTATIGGNKRVARLLPISGWDPDFERALAGAHLPQDPKDGARFWVWATTPVLSSRPRDPGLTSHALGGATVEVVMSSVGPVESIGGFSMANQSSGDSRAHLSAGSAWLISVRGGTSADRGGLVRSLHDRCCLGEEPAARTFGFGHALVALPFENS